MKNPNIYITTEDFQVLKILLRGLPMKNETVKRLHEELSRAIVFDAADLPEGTIRLNDEVRLLDIAAGEEETYIPVLPAKSDPENNRISVLVPMGAALIGFREGDEFEWTTPGGARRLRVLSVSRTETAASTSG